MTTPPSNLIPLLAHPTRRKILRIFMADAKRGRRSPIELSKALDMPVNHVAYHVRVLAGNKALRRSGTKPARGATEHFYEVGDLLREHEDVVLVLLSADEGTEEGEGKSRLTV